MFQWELSAHISEVPISLQSIHGTLDHLTFRALYFSRIAFELYFRAFYIWQERTTRKIEDNSCLRFVSLLIQTP